MRQHFECGAKTAEVNKAPRTRTDMAQQLSASQINGLYRRCLESHQAGKLTSAEKLYLKLLKIIPDDAEILRNFAVLRFQQGKRLKALEIMERARCLEPRSKALEHNLGKFLLEMGRYDEAEKHFRASLSMAPDFGDALADLGATLSALGRYQEAIDYLKRAVRLTPPSTVPLVNLGSIRIFLNKYTAAEEIFGRALAIDPDDLEIRLALGRAQYRNERLSEAIATFETLLERRPGHLRALSGLLHAKLRICNWAGLKEQMAEFRHALSAADGRRPEATPSPYTSLLVCDDPAECFAAARGASALLSNRHARSSRRRAGIGRDKIKIAYLSADYREHATSYLISELIELHDRSVFEVTGISFGPNDASPMRQRMQRAFDRFEDLTEQSASAIAARLAELSIDIAVDLQGFNQYNRMEIFSCRAAPVQVLYLGWPGTSGANFYDYVLADPIVLPEENFKYFSEKIVWLRHCYQPNDGRRKIAPEAPRRADCGLPEAGFVFCCFNNTFKILPEIFDIWMRLLRQIPGSVLWLLETNGVCRENLAREAGARGVNETRVIFAPRIPNDRHLARLANADLFLDTMPYNAHTTASDALWQGVPVVTCTGRTFPSRVATSLLHGVGLAELAAENLADYEAIALRLAQEPAKTAEIKKRLLDGRATAPLFDTRRLMHEIEAAYREMIRRADHGVAPDFIDVRALAE